MLVTWRDSLVGMAYVGAVVGAGFASGQEIWQFFGRHGTWGTVGILVAGALFWQVGRRALSAGRSGVQDFHRLLRSRYAPRVAAGLDAIITAFLALGLVVVVAGGGAAIRDLWGWPARWGSLITLLAICLAASRGVAGVLGATTVLVPFLMAVTLPVALLSPGRLTGVGVPGWWLSASLYVSYNLFTGLVVLLGLGKNLSSVRAAGPAALVGAALLTAMALAIHRAVLGVATVGDIPLMHAASALGGPWPALYGVALLAALFTTGVGQAFGLVQRYGQGALVGTLCLWPLSWLGFSALVAYLYPVMGAVSVVFLLPLFRPRLN